VSTDRDVTRIVRSWLDEGVTQLPDRVLDSVLDQVPMTPQRRAPMWAARRFTTMNYTVRIGLAAAAVVVTALIGYQLLSGPNVGDPGPTATPQPTSTPARTPVALRDGPLEPGEHVTHPFDAPNDSLSFTFTVPAGWSGFGKIGVLPEQGGAGPDGMGMGFSLVTGLYSDPCHGVQPDVTVGPTVDELVTAFLDQTAYEATTPTDVTLSGHSGKQMDLIMPSGANYTSCYLGGSTVWQGSIHAQGPGNVWHLWILDVEGVRVVILAQDNPGTSAEDKAELLAIVDSIEIEP
jgi:hypothetical protein